MGFLKQQCWSGLLFPPPGDLPHLGVKPMTPHTSQSLQVDSLPLSHLGNPKELLETARQYLNLFTQLHLILFEKILIMQNSKNMYFIIFQAATSIFSFLNTYESLSAKGMQYSVMFQYLILFRNNLDIQ